MKNPRSFHPLERACHVFVALAVLAPLLAYPLALQPGPFNRVKALFLNGGKMEQLFFEHIGPLLYGFRYVLELKQTAAALPMLLLGIVWIWWKAAEAAAHGGRLQCKGWKLHVPLALLLAWCATSLIWAPGTVLTPLQLSREGLWSLSMILLFALFFMIVYDLRKPPELVMKWSYLFFGAMLIIGAISYMQHAEPQLIWKVLPKLEHRNRVGSLTGHNITVAAFALMALFLALARIFDPDTRWPLCTALGAFSLLMIVLIIIAQSRAVWIFTLIGLAVFLTGAKRLSGLKLGSKFWSILGFIAVLFALLQVNPESSLNVLNHRGTRSLISRLGDFKPSVILQGTRFRILVCSGPLAAGSPLHGYGLGSFATVYPEAQGRYMSRHPGTILQPTRNITEHAHNDYLELLIETGAPGLLLALAAIFFYWRAGWRGCKRLRRRRDQLIYLAVGCIVMTALLHGLNFFPMRIAHHAALFLLFGAIWASAGRDAEDENDAPPDAPIVQPPALTLRWRYLLLLIGALAGALWLTLMIPWFSKPFVRSFWLARAGVYQDNKMYLKANQALERAWAADPGNRDTSFEMAVARHYEAQRYARKAVSLKEEGAPEAKEVQRKAEQYFQEALNYSALYTAARPNHRAYFFQGTVFEALAKLYDDDPRLRRAAKDSYEHAVRLTKAHPQTLERLINLYAEEDNDPMVRQYRKYLYEYCPDEWNSNYILPIYDLVNRGEYERAISIARQALSYNEKDQSLLRLIALTYIESGDVTASRLFLRDALKNGLMEQTNHDYCMMMADAEQKRWQSVLRDCDQILANPGAFRNPGANGFDRDQNARDRINVQVFRYLCLRKMERMAEAREMFDQFLPEWLDVEKNYSSGPNAYVYSYRQLIPIYFFQFFDEPEAAMKEFYRLKLEDGIVPGGLLYIMVFRYQLGRGEIEHAERELEALKTLYPEYAVISTLEAELRKKTAPQDDATSATATQADDDVSSGAISGADAGE
ncbi:O-antigen ligase family protein [Candidatus Sumerlaeota bacterium]|nr:O-antigen ligase family protein [Candidatus Sumerlaeota bacterium]